MFKRIVFFICLFACMAMVFNTAGFAKPGKGNSGKGGNPFADAVAGGKGNTGKNSKLDLFNVKGIKSGLIQVDKNIFYPTDTLDVSVVFPKSLKAIWNGDAYVYLVIRMADGSMLTPFQALVSGQVPDKPKTFVSLDLSQTPLQSGDYQLALIMVNPGGDALNLSDWYGGFSGLISATTFEVATQCDPADTDCDGIVEASGLIVTPSSITPDKGGFTDLTVANGTPPYTIESGDTGIATVSTDTLDPDGTFTVTATGTVGDSTTVTVTDNIGDMFIVNVVVQDTVAVAADPVSVSIAVSETATVTASGGVGGFTAASADTGIASVSISGDTVTITGVAAGTVDVTITDNNGESVIVPVTVTDTSGGVSLLTAGATTASVTAGETTSVTISGGSGGYTASTSNDTVATASITTTNGGDEVEILGVAQGDAVITVEDSDSNSVSVDVSVNAASN